MESVKLNNKNKIVPIYIIYAILTLLCVYISFANLDHEPIQHWDEARHGVNAYEMLKQGNLIVNTYNYENDYYNLKPPLSYWGIMIGFKLFGTNVFGLRFFSGLSMLLTFLLIGVYMHRKEGKVAAVSSMLFFLNLKDMFFFHGGRNADADAMYILLFTIGCLSLIESKNNIRYLYLCGFIFSLCFLTKSWHACILLPIGGLFVLFSGLMKEMKVKDYLYLITITLLPILLWIVIRYSYDGMNFLGQMFGVDVAERVSWPVSANEDGLFYIKYIAGTKGGRILLISIFFSIFCLCSNLWIQKKVEKRLFFKSKVLVTLLWIFVTLFTFSVTRADNYWYIYPLYPGMCVAAGMLLQKSFDIVSKAGKANFMMVIFGTGMLAMFFLAVDTAYGVKEYPISNFQKDVQRVLEAHPELHGLKIYVEKSNNEYKNSFYWEQAGILMAELSGDMKCEEGGVEAYLREEEALLVVDYNYYEKYREELKGFQVLYRNEYIVLKNYNYSELSKFVENYDESD